jgi:hypothetical protein
MFGLDAPPPSGPRSPDLMRLMGNAARSGWFRRKIHVWCWVRRMEAFDWDRFQVKFNEAEFREYRDKWQAKRSVAWAGQNPDNSEPQWRFGVCASVRRLWLIGRSAIDHELFHAAQDVQWNGELFRPPEPLPWPVEVLVEMEAHLFGGPLIGFPWLLVLVLCLLAGGLLVWEIMALVILLPWLVLPGLGLIAVGWVVWRVIKKRS